MMVRKQLYIEERHERELKRRAKALGISEADVVRQALDALLSEAPSSRPLPMHEQAIAEFLARAKEFTDARKGLPKTKRYTREELYEERESRWVKGR